MNNVVQRATCGFQSFFGELLSELILPSVWKGGVGSVDHRRDCELVDHGEHRVAALCRTGCVMQG